MVRRHETELSPIELVDDSGAVDEVEWLPGPAVDRSVTESTDHTGRFDRLYERLMERGDAQAVVVSGSNTSPRTRYAAQIVQATSVDPEEVIAELDGGYTAGRGLHRLSLPPHAARADVAAAPVVSSTTYRDDGRAVRLVGTLTTLFPPVRKVTLRVYPTTSGNLTVLELVPVRKWPYSTRSFVRAGVAAVTDLTDRLEGRARP